jgi:hypothetical protein
MRVLLIVFGLILGISVKAQFLTAAGAGNNVLRETQYVGVDGSPYLFNEWKNGAILERTGQLSENMMIRYDSYRDEVQFLKDGRTLVVEPAIASGFSFLILNEETKRIENILFRNGFTVDGYTKLNYFRVVYDGKVKFLKKIKTGYIDETVNNFGTNEQVKKFVTTEEEFLLKADGSAVKIGKGRKDLLTHFGDSSGQMKTFIKENKLNLKSESDLIRVLEKFESLSN